VLDCGPVTVVSMTSQGIQAMVTLEYSTVKPGHRRIQGLLTKSRVTT